MADEVIFAPRTDAQKSATSDVVLQAQTPKMDTSGSVVFAPRPTETAAKETTTPLQGSVEQFKALDYIRAGLEQSQDDTHDAVVWSGAMAGITTDEQAALMTQRSTLQRQRDAGIKTYENTHYLSVEHVVKEIASTGPYLMEMAKETIPFTAAGTAAGAAHGALVGGETGVWFAPVVGGPVAIPAGAAAGAVVEAGIGSAVGTRAGIALSAARLAAGAKFKQLYQDEHVPRDTAIKSSLAYGAVAGALQAAQFGRAAIVTTKALTVVKSQMQQNMFHILGNLAKEVGLFTGVADLQESANILTDTMIGHVGLHQPPNADEIGKRLKDSTFKSAVTGVGALGTAHAIGTVSGKIFSFKEAAQNTHDAMTRESGAPTAQEAELEQTKAEYALARAEDKHAAAKDKLAEARAEGAPTKALELAVSVAKQELALAQSKVPIKLIEQVAKEDTPPKPKKLQGRVELTPQKAVDAAERERHLAENKVSNLEQEAIDYKRNNLDTPIPKELETELADARLQLQISRAYKRHAERDLIDHQINEIQAAAKSKFVIESDETDLQEFTRNQKLMHGLVEKSGLPDELKGAFNTAIRDSKTTKQLLRVAYDHTTEKGEVIKGVRTRIAEKLDAEARKDAMQQLNKQVKRIAPRKQNGHPYSRFGREGEIQDVLNEFERFIKNPEALAQVHSEMKAAEETGADTSELYLPQQIGNMVGDLKLKTPNEIYKLADTLETLIDTGLKGRAKEIANESADIKNTTAELEKAIQGGTPIELGVSTNKPRKTLSDLEKYANRAGTTMFSWMGKLEVATKDSLGNDAKAVLAKLEIRKTVRDVSHTKLTEGRRLFGHLEAETGLKQDQILKKIAEGSTKSSEFTIKYTDTEGQSKFMTLTPMQGVDALMKIQDPSLNLGSLTRNSDLPDGAPSFERQITNALAEKDPVYMDLAAGYKSYYQDAYTPLAKAVKEGTGVTLPRNPDYPGYTQRYGYKDRTATEQFNLHIEEIGRTAFNKVGASRPAHIKERNSDLEVQFQNAHVAVTKYINASAQYIGWVKEAKRLGAILSNKRVTEVLYHKFGPELHRDIISHLKAAVRGGVDEQAALVDLMNHLMRNVPVAALGLKPLMAVKHALAIQNTLLKMPAKDLITGVTDYWRNKRKADAVINSSKAFEVRNSDPSGNLLGAEATTNKHMSEHEAAKRLVLLPIWGGANQFAIRPSMWALYTMKLKELNKEKPGDPENHRTALDEAETIIDFQTSGTIDQLSNAARSPIGKPFTLFHQLPQRLWEESWLAWGKYFREQSGEALTNAIRIAIITHIGVALFPFVDALWKQFTDSSERNKYQAWSVFWLALAHGPLPPLWGEGLDAAYMGVANAFNKDPNHRYYVHELGTIQTDMINHTVKLFTDLTRDLVNGTWGMKELLELGLDTAQSPIGMMSGIPAAPPLKLTRQAIGKPEDSKTEAH